MKKELRKAVFIVTYRKEGNKIFYLLLKRKLHWKGWEFPKGGVENEYIRKAVHRELFEETGQHAVKIKSYKISGRYFYDKMLEDRPGYIGQTYRLFSAQIKSKSVKIDKKEHSDYKWLEFEKAWSLLKWPNQKSCLNFVNKRIRNKI